MERKKIIKLASLFVFSYVILYIAGMFTPMHAIDFSPGFAMLDYMFVLIPLPGFFFMYFSIDWINSFFGDNTANKPWFPVALFVLSIPAYFVALYFFFGNVANLSGDQVQATELFDFWAKFWDSAFLYFVLAAILGWVSHQIIEKPLEKNE